MGVQEMIWIAPIVAGTALCVCLLVLRRYPFATSRLIQLRELATAYLPPQESATGLAWGPMPISVRKDCLPAPLRTLVDGMDREGLSSRAGEDGLDAAVRVMSFLQHRVPHGLPAFEYVDWSYDLNKAAERHVRLAERGHCVSRSSLAAAILIGWGYAARVVSFADSAVRFGHTAIEVWSRKHEKWVFLDSNSPLLLCCSDKELASLRDYCDPGSDLGLVDSTTRIPLREWPERLDLLSRSATTRADLLFYPEPWLYLRCVPKARSLSRATWMFFGLSATSRFGVPQRRLQSAIAALGSAAAAALIAAACVR